VSLVLLLGWQRGAGGLWRALRQGSAVLWLSGLCWSVMFTAFMLALTLTTVANVLVTEALGPILTALIARYIFGRRLPGRTWGAITVAAIGIVWMYGAQVRGGQGSDLLGVAVALSVPLGGATMWSLLEHNARLHPEQRQDMTPAVLIGAVLSSLYCLPLALPLSASAHDIASLTGLGLVQLAIPCVLAVAAGKVLRAPEAALLGLLEIVFGVAWTWISGSEAPTLPVVGGGLLVLAALALNELLALRGGTIRS
jgi:drug/metabolite transporter (DMT)-like permease